MTAAATLAAFVGLALTAGLIGWLYGRGALKRKAPAHKPGPPPELPDGYYAGLHSLINEQPDRAVEIFTRLVEVDQDTIETHFALGSLYRRRGEVDRAIRIHENILARPKLSREHHQQALWALAQDFLRAGVLDRSEKLLRELAATPAHRDAALLALLRVYETENEWALAVAIHRDLPAEVAASRATAIAHYHCELALGAIRQGKPADARRYLRLARRLAPGFARASLMRADLAAARGAHDLAARLLVRALGDDWNLLLEALPRLIEAVQRSGHTRHLDALVDQVGRQRGGRAADLAQALILADVAIDGPLGELVDDFITGEAEFAELLTVLDAGGGPRTAGDRRRAVRALLKHSARGQRYQCASCGFSSQALFWQCPGCRSWDSMKPIWMLAGLPGGSRRR
ncbi:MAG TPA: tetratricopeptide repeat protein [Steroidobacteraceae bacterium]|nr:tetratricopeptide repeat protein [Steroidobacteraceae bacterium]